MSRSEFELIVESADPLAELTIVDARYTTRAQGLGRLVCKLPPGLYVTRARSGEKTEKKTVRVRDENVTVTFSERGALRSSAPLDHQSFEQARLNVINAAPAIGANADAWVLLALRHAAGRTTPTFLPVQSAEGFQLLSRTSTNPIEFGAYPLIPTPTGHWVIALRIRQGWYELSIPGDSGSRIRLPLYAGQRFSPSVFVELREDETGPPRPDLDRLLVSYDDSEFGIFRNDDRMRAIELARRSLVLGRNILTPALMEIFYRQKFADPILGLFAAYLLLTDPKGEKHFVEVVENTGQILQYPQYPDLVIARALGRQKGWWKSTVTYPGDHEPLVAPPLLRASWDGMLTLTDRSEEVVASPQLRMIASTLIRSSVWVLWRPPSTGAGTAARESAAPRKRKSAAGPDALLSGLIDRLRTDPALASTFREELASETYEGGKLSRAIARTALELTSESEKVHIPRGYTKRLADALSVPVPLLADEIQTISDALGAAARAGGDAQKKKKTVLLVEDNALDRELTNTLLEGAGYDVLLASDAANALTLMAKENVDLMLLDIDLPFIDGHKMIEALREKGIDVPAIFISGLPGDEPEVRASDIGAADFIRKPVKNNILLARVAKVLKDV